MRRIFLVWLVGFGCGSGGPSPLMGTPDAPPVVSVPDAPPVSTSTCGNRVLEPGEACESDADCTRRERCSAACACVALDPPPAETSQVLIDDDYRAGTIDLGTALLYRAYADFDDPRLPEAYDGIGPDGEDPMLVVDLVRAMPGLPAAEQAALQPFVVRPTDPASVFTTGVAAEAGARARRAGLDDGPDCSSVSGCAEGWVSTDTDHFRVWSCGDDEAGRAEVSGFAEGLYGPETQLMGPPKDDTFDNGGGPPTIDIYLVALNQSRMRNGTCQTIPAIQPAGAIADPSSSDKASGYLYVLWPYPGSNLEITLDHEFFHVLEFAHSVQATQSWLREACAVWAETFFGPVQDRQREVYNGLFAAASGGNDFIDRMAIPLDERNAMQAAGTTFGHDLSYNAFIYPFFAAQEAGFNVIPNLWNALEAPGSIDGAVDQVFGWRAHYKDFILRNVNDGSLPAAGLKRYSDADSGFNEDTWQKLPAATSVDDGQLGNGGMIVGSVALRYLTSQYHHFKVEGDTTKQLTFDFTQLPGGDNLDVELLLQVGKDGTSWKHVSMAGMRKYTICTETDPPDVYEVRIALGNHDWKGEQTIAGGFRVSSKPRCCPEGQTCYSGNVQVTSNIVTPYGTIQGSIAASVVWQANPDDPTGSTFEPTGSATYTASGMTGACAVTLKPTTFAIANQGSLQFFANTNPLTYIANGNAGPAGSTVTYHFDCPTDQGGSFDLPGDVKPWLLISMPHAVNPDGSLTGSESHADGISYTWSFSP